MVQQLSDQVISDETLDLFFHFFAVWKRIEEIGLEMDGYIRTIVLSSVAMLATKVKIDDSQGMSRVLKSSKGNEYAVFDGLRLRNAYYMHADIMAEMHGRTKDEARKLWLPYNARLIEKNERGMVVFVACDQSVVDVMANGRPTIPMGERIWQFKPRTDLDFALYLPLPEEVAYWRAAYANPEAQSTLPEVMRNFLQKEKR